MSDEEVPPLTQQTQPRLQADALDAQYKLDRDLGDGAASAPGAARAARR